MEHALKTYSGNGGKADGSVASWPDPSSSRHPTELELAMPNIQAYGMRNLLSAQTRRRQTSMSNSSQQTQTGNDFSDMGSQTCSQAGSTAVASRTLVSDEDATQPDESANLPSPTEQDLREIIEALFSPTTPQVHTDHINIELDSVFAQHSSRNEAQCASCQNDRVKCIRHPGRTACNRCRKKRQRCDWGGQE